MIWSHSWGMELETQVLQTALDDPESKEKDEEEVEGEIGEEGGSGRRSKESSLLSESQTLAFLLVLLR